MLDDFMVRATIGGIGVALAAGPLGCFVVWQRMAYLGSALSHSALLGVALGVLLGLNLTATVMAVCVLLGLLFFGLERLRVLSGDTVLGILAHGALALGMVVVSFLEGLRVDLMGYLFGDLLAVGRLDLVVIYGTLAVVVLALVKWWRPLLSATVNEELAAAEGVPLAAVRLSLILLLAVVVAVGMKVVGILLIVSLLIVPAAAARRMAATPEAMAFLAAAVGVVSVLLGMAGSFQLDIPSGPAIVVAAAALFAVLMLVPRRAGERGRGPHTQL